MNAPQAQKSSPGWCYTGNQQFIPLPEVHRTSKLTASEAADAVALRALKIDRVSGCEVVAIEDLFQYSDMRAGKS